MTRAFFPIIFAALGCSSGEPSSAVISDGAVAPDAPQPDYGTTPGKVIQDFALLGYVRSETTGLASEAPFASVRLYSAAQKTGARYAFIHTAGFWCSTCATAAKQIVAAWPAFAAKAVFIEILTEGSTPTVVATKANLDVWVKATQMPFTAAIDVGADQALRPMLGVEDTSYVVDLATMKIVDRSVDWARLLDEMRDL